MAVTIEHVISFGSDNHSGVHPEVLAAISSANSGHTGAYGDDPWSRQAKDALRDVFGPDSVPLLLYVMLEEKVDFITARRWYSKSGEVKSPIRLLGNAILSGAMMTLYFKFIIDSQSGMWMFKKEILPDLDLTSNGMALSEEIKIEAFTHPGIRCLEMPIYYGARIGESKLNIWRDGFYNLFFLVKKRFMLRKKQPRLRVVEPIRPASTEVVEPIERRAAN